MAQTIVLSKNKLQYKELVGDVSTDYVKLDFNQTEIKANADLLHATNNLTVGGNSNITGNFAVTGKSALYDKLTVSAGGMEVSADGMQVHGGGSTFHNGLVVAEGLTVIQGVNIINGGLEVPIGHAARIQGTLFVGTDNHPQNSTLKGDLDVSGMAHHGGLEVTGQSTLGVLVANESTLNSLTVTNASSLNSGLTVIGNSVVQKLNASDEVNFNGGVFNVLGTSNLKGALNVQMSQPTNLSGSLTVGGTSGLAILNVSGASNIAALNAAATNISSTLDVTGQSNLNGGLNVTGQTSIGALSVDRLQPTTLSGSLTVGGTSTLANAAVTGTLAVTGVANLSSSLAVGGAATLSSTLDVVGSSTLGVLTVGGASTLNSLTVSGLSALTGALNVTGISSLGVLIAGNSTLNTLSVTTNSNLRTVNISENLNVQGDSILATLNVTGNSSLNNMYAGGDSTVVGNASVGKKLTVTGDSTLNGALTVNNTSTLNGALTVTTGGLTVTGESTLNNKLKVSSGGMDVYGTTTMRGATTIDNTLALSNTLTAQNGLIIYGTSNFNGGLNASQGIAVTGLANLSGNMAVGGAMADIQNNLQVQGNSSLGPLTVRNNTNLNGNLQVNGNSSLGALTVRSGQETNLLGTLAVSGESFFTKATLAQAVFGLAGILDLTNQGTANIHNLNANNLAVTGNSALSGNLAVTGNSALTGNLAVTGVSNLSDKLTVSSGGMDIYGASTIRNELTQLTITANGMQVTGTSTFDTLIASSSDIAGNVNAGTLSVTGASDLKGALTVGTTAVKVASQFNGDVTISGNFHVTGTGTKTTLNTEELKVKDTTITIGEGNAADTLPMALEMAYKASGIDKKAGLRRLPGNNDGFHLFKNCVNDSDAIIYDSLTVETLSCFSDINLKKNIVTIDGALDKLDGIRGVYHDWINTKQSEDRQIGVIAQEVQAVYPELVHENENGYLTVNYPKLTAVLLQSIKELKAMVLEICAKQAL